MKKPGCFICFYFIFIFQLLEAQTRSSITDTSNSKYAQWKSVDISNIKITEGFWAKRLSINREVSFQKLWELAVNPHEGHVLQNFNIAARLHEGEFKGTKWQDAWMYKWLEAASYILAQDTAYIFMNHKLTDLVDEVIEVISEAQAPDGYIATQRQIANNSRLINPRHHEFYTMGHLLTAASVHYRITHKANFLHIAEKTATFCLNWFKAHEDDPTALGFPFNPSIIMGAVELYRTTGKQAYLELAERVVNRRGARYQEDGHAIRGSENNQNYMPLREETEVIGHAVFFTYLYAGATDVYLETGDTTLLNALERLWTDLTEKKMYVNGGVGNSFSALPTRKFKQNSNRTILTNDRINEGVDKPYNLTNFDAYNETCAMVGNMMWNWRMLQATGKAKYADIMELSLYNSILSGVKLTGDKWIYCNGLGWYGTEQETLHKDKQRWGTPGRNYICCPTNILRNVAAYNGYLYTQSEKAIQIHQYATGSADINIESAGHIRFSLQTAYPWNGKINFSIGKVSSGDSIEIAFRIPGWSDKSTVLINDTLQLEPVHPQSYYRVKRLWKKGDRVELNLDMSVKLLCANTKNEFARNLMAVKRGPILYCLEEPDIPSDADLFDIAISPTTQWQIQYEDNLLHGVTTLGTDALLYDKPGKNIFGQYSKFPESSTKISIRLIPYFTWRNRGLENKMEVWIPVY